MKTVINRVPEMSLAEFADQHDLTLEISERRHPGLPRYYAAFQRCEVMEDHCLVGVHGNGQTPEDATADYALRISLTRIAVNAYREDRREIEVPRLKEATP